MILDINYLIDFFRKHTTKTDKNEMGEQETSGESSGGGGKVPKWSDSYNITRGKANRLGLAGEKWETGMTRGAANKIW